MHPFIDSFERKIAYLRISITDRCNLRCNYCMPKEGLKLLRHEEVLSFEEIARLAELFASCGVKKVRVTGGEPLVRADCVKLIRMLSKIKGLDELCMTTNGLLLSKFADELKDAGLKRINISLDTLNKEKFQWITGLDALEDVLRGIDAALEAGLTPVKINVVALRGINDDELFDFAGFAEKKKLEVRFIELMPTKGNSLFKKERFISSDEVRKKMGRLRTPHFSFINPLSQPFCGSCDRLRLRADGKLKRCLHDEELFDVKCLMRSGAGDLELLEMMRGYIIAKNKWHGLTADGRDDSRLFMSEVGG